MLWTGIAEKNVRLFSTSWKRIMDNKMPNKRSRWAFALLADFFISIFWRVPISSIVSLLIVIGEWPNIFQIYWRLEWKTVRAKNISKQIYFRIKVMCEILNFCNKILGCPKRWLKWLIEFRYFEFQVIVTKIIKKRFYLWTAEIVG